MKSPFPTPRIFNPGFSPPEELLATSILHVEEFRQIFDSTRSDPTRTSPRDYLIKGPIGSGKTSILLRLYVELKHDPDLGSSVLPVLFDEEQYNIRTLADFWLAIIDYLVHEYDGFAGLAVANGQLSDPGARADERLDFLLNALRERGKRLVLLLDNLGDILRKFSPEENRELRQTLTTRGEFKVIGATSTPLETLKRGNEPLYDFFRVISLGGLTGNEAAILLRRLGEIYGAETINEVLSHRPERIEALRRITGGIPRTLVQLFGIVTHNIDGSPADDLEALLDLQTPSYKQRLDGLSTQEQVIFDALARHWDATSTRILAQQIQMESKAVASQLNQMVMKQIVRKIRTSTKNHLYQVSDRLFNIWFLMRSRNARKRNQVHWFIRFLEEWCRQTRDEHPPFFQFSSASPSGTVRSHDVTEDFMVTSNEPMQRAYTDVVQAVRAGKHLAAAQQLIERGFPPQVVWSMLGDIVRDELKDFPKAASYYKVAADKGEVNALLKLALLYDRELNSIEKAEEYFRLAAGYGDTEALALQAASYFEKRWRKPDALRIMRQAIQAVASEQNAFGLVMILLWNDEISEAIDLYGDKFANVLGQNEVSMRVTQILLMFLAKRQYQFINTLFRENTFDIRDKYKPVYFAMLSLMGATRADELRVMGPEYEETVEEIVREVKRVEAYDL